MKNYALLFFILFTNIHSFGRETNNTKYVWAVNGLNMRSAPAVNGKIIKTLSYGDSVVVRSYTEIKHEVIYIDSSFSGIHPIQLNGKWIKVKAGQKEGFVVDAFLLDIPCAQEGENLNAYAIRLSSKFTLSTLTDSFRTFYGENLGLMVFNTAICKIPIGYEISFTPQLKKLASGLESQLIEQNESVSESFYFKGFSLQELLVFLNPFYMSRTENPFKVYEKGERHIRMTDTSTQTIDMWFFEKDIIIFLFEDAGC